MTERSIAQEDRRRQILDAAIRVFARKGYHTSRVGDIAEEAGVAHGLLYHYFASKEALLETVFRETWSQIVEAIGKIEASGEAAGEQLRRVAAIYLPAWARDPDLVRVLVREVARSPQVQRQVDEIAEVFRANRQDHRTRASAGRTPRGRRRASCKLDLLRRPRGDPHGLGARAAA